MPNGESITASFIKQRLAKTRLPDDPLDVVLPDGSHTWPAGVREELTSGLKPAGVLIPVIERSQGLTVLLTERAAELRLHAGQISFPGGRMESADAHIGATALRETHEEVGIAPDNVTILGYLDPMPTVTGYAVTPVVGSLSAPPALKLDRNEVKSAFEVPLDYLLDRNNVRPGERDFRGGKIAVAEFLYRDRRIWGATAHILVQLRIKLLNK